jgi:prophage regulatory protein
MANNNQEKLFMLRCEQVKNQTGLSRSTIYLRIQEGTFPRPVNLGPRAVGWPSIEVDAINAARIAGKNDEEIRALVAKLEANRKGVK